MLFLIRTLNILGVFFAYLLAGCEDAVCLLIRGHMQLTFMHALYKHTTNNKRLTNQMLQFEPGLCKVLKVCKMLNLNRHARYEENMR